jgi:hypothetical protein
MPFSRLREFKFFILPMGEYCTLTSYDYSITILLLMHLNFSCCFVILYGWAYSSGNIYVAFWLYDLREVKMFTTVVKIWGGPGIGKTTCALMTAGELSIQAGPKRTVEYVGEYAKQVIWQNKTEELAHQPTIARGQMSLLAPIGECDFIVTDSPLELGLLYSKEEHFSETEAMIAAFNEQHPHREINIFLARDRQDFQAAGRIHSLEESMELDREILRFLKINNIHYEELSNMVSASDLCRIILQDHE